MNKNLFALAALLLCSFSLFMSSCSDDDDNSIDEEWKAYNEKIVSETASNPEYKSRVSFTGNGSVYWKNTDFFDLEDEKNNKLTPTPKITASGTPYVTDSVIVRYEGWFYLKDGTKYIFDSTEGDNNQQSGKLLSLNNLSQITGGVNDRIGVIGWLDVLLQMHEGNAVEVCIPYQLGFGEIGLLNTSYQQVVPGYTTLWYRIKLLKIMADNEGEFD